MRLLRNNRRGLVWRPIGLVTLYIAFVSAYIGGEPEWEKNVKIVSVQPVELLPTGMQCEDIRDSANERRNIDIPATENDVSGGSIAVDCIPFESASESQWDDRYRSVGGIRKFDVLYSIDGVFGRVVLDQDPRVEKLATAP